MIRAAPRLLAVAAVAVVFCAARPGHAAPPEAPPVDAAAEEKQRRVEQAVALHDEARALYQRGEYRAAIRKLEEAARLDPEGKELVYNLAVIHEKLAELPAAEAYYRRYRDMEKDPKAREQVDAVLRRLEGAKKQLPPPTEPPRAPAAPAAPPAPAAPAAPEPAAERPIGPWVVATGSLAAGALVIGNVFALSALVRDPGSSAMTGGDVSVRDLQADARAAHRDAILADVALIAAGIAGTAAVCLYFSTPPRRAAPPAPPAAPAAPAPAPPRPFSSSGASSARAGAPGDGAAAAGSVGVALGAGGVRVEVRF